MGDTFGEGSYVFIPDDEEMFIPARVHLTFKQGEEGAVVAIEDESTSKKKKQRVIKLTPDQTKLCVPMDIQSLSGVANLVELKQLNEASILESLRLRFKQDQIYTSIGSILVSVNPFKMLDLYTPSVMQDYLKNGAHMMPPHIYGVGDLAYNAMVSSNKPQACIVSGESGAGKDGSPPSCSSSI